MLREETYSVVRGKARVSVKFIPLEENIRFTFGMLLSTAGVPFRLAGDDTGWAAFCRSLRVRHRITHPKNAAELEITGEEMEDLSQGHLWYFETELDCLRQSHLAVVQEIARREARTSAPKKES